MLSLEADPQSTRTLWNAVNAIVPPEVDAARTRVCGARFRFAAAALNGAIVSESRRATFPARSPGLGRDKALGPTRSAAESARAAGIPGTRTHSPLSQGKPAQATTAIPHPIAWERRVSRDRVSLPAPSPHSPATGMRSKACWSSARPARTMASDFTGCSNSRRTHSSASLCPRRAKREWYLASPKIGWPR